VIDTMKRIPYGQNQLGVYDNLVEVSRLDLATFSHERDVEQRNILQLSRRYLPALQKHWSPQKRRKLVLKLWAQ
jgi:hypothetical protein